MLSIKLNKNDKEHIFKHVDESGFTEMEYPLDDVQLGRIVGEIHLDHCSVDFLKQRFEPTSELEEALFYLKGPGIRLP